MTDRHILEAFWETRDRGIVVLARDWLEHDSLPPLAILPGPEALKLIRRVPPLVFARRAGYCLNGDELIFMLWPKYFPNLDWEDEELFVAGDFNGWIKAAGQAEWRMWREKHDGQECLVLRVPRARCYTDEPVRFKFITGETRWQEPPEEAPNRDYHNDATNYLIQPERTGLHLFHFWAATPHDVQTRAELVWAGGDEVETCFITNSEYLLTLGTDRPLGARVEGDRTVFRLFAPRATRVRLRVYTVLGGPVVEAELVQHADGCWECVLPQNLHGQYYDYLVEGENVHGTRFFDPGQHILDPYALAAVGPRGPGIVLDPAKMPAPSRCFIPPHWHNLTIVEAHVRDVLARAALELTPGERRGFKGLTKWLRRPDCYLRQLGVNAVELLPIQEFDYARPEDYQWGYMPVNYFAPASAYATAPEEGTQVAEFGELVEAFHDAGLAVILDVVYNHFGDPNHLLGIDKYYFFECDRDGRLANWSGCGNDLRTATPMGRRLVLDSLVHLVRAYDVDGFRFDLAELVGVATLQEIEAALKPLKPSIILIAEPWSMRGHIGHALRHTGFASWNDGFREFITQYLLGQGNQDGIFYFLSGSPGNLALWPAQTVNYVQSHDDRAWLDRITENHWHRGDPPTRHDIRRHQLMIAILMASLGIPMIAEGQDLLHSKQGVNNTYQRGDLNALDYRRMVQFPAYNEYFRRWIRFRSSPAGEFFRHDGAPPEGYFGRFSVPDTSAVGLLYNANRSRGEGRLFFAINPHLWPVAMDTYELAPAAFRQIADHERFNADGLDGARFFWRDGKLELPALSVGLWYEA